MLMLDETLQFMAKKIELHPLYRETDASRRFCFAISHSCFADEWKRNHLLRRRIYMHARMWGARMLGADLTAVHHIPCGSLSP